MLSTVCSRQDIFPNLWRKLFCSFGFLVILQFCLTQSLYSQQFQPQYFAPQQQNRNLITSSVFRQEIARFQITVERNGKAPLPITQVPRVQQGDVLKVKLLDEAVGGIKLDQSNWDWTFLVTFINPLRRMDNLDGKSSAEKTKVPVKIGDKPLDSGGTVSEEIQFRKKGWYKEYSFVVPYDSQPVFFLYPRPKYRKQLLKVVNSKYEEIRKLGEKTIELAGAYSQINTFLNELQFVLNRNAQQYGFTYNGNRSTTTTGSSTYNPYGTTYNPANPYGNSSTYNPYAPYNTTTNNQPNQVDVPVFGLPMIPMLNHIVEGLARSFNIQLPSCWGNGSSYGSSYGSYGNSSGFGNYGSSGSYNSGYGNSGSYGGYSSYGSNYGTTPMMDFVNRAQCVAKNVSLEQFDISVTRMWQQGGVFLAAELQKKYPQIAYWINIAAAAIDFIVKVFQKAPLRIVPTVIQSSDGQTFGGSSSGGGGNGGVGSMGGSSFNNSYSANSSGNYSPNSSAAYSPNNQNPNLGKISLFADSQPAEGQFITAYPIVTHKWQANPDPEVISLYPPILAEPCLHAGTNILKSIELANQTNEDTYSKDFRLVVSSTNGFRKEFPLRKNLGVGGWELNLTQEDLNQIPKIQMTLEAELVGTRGFNEIKSPKFELPLATSSNWEITAESQKNFTVGGKRTITIRNTTGNCRCLQRVIYKPSFGGQFVFEAGGSSGSGSFNNGLQISADGKEVSFEIDATAFQPGSGTIEIKTLGGETNNQSPSFNQPSGQSFSAQGQSTQYQSGNQGGGSNNLNLKLYPAPPLISEVKARRGDKEILLTGERLEQLQFLNINGKRAVVKGRKGDGETGNFSSGQFNSNQRIPNQPPNQYSSSNQPNPMGMTGQFSPTPLPLISSSQNSPAQQIVSQYQNLSPNQRVAVLEDGQSKITGDYLNLELFLEDNRSLSYPGRFAVGSSRPALKANEMNEIEGKFVRGESRGMRDEKEVVIQNQTVMVNGSREISRKSKETSRKAKGEGQRTKDKGQNPQIDLTNYPIVLLDKNEMTVAVQNILTDYNFRTENLSLETNLENATTTPNQLPTVSFEVLDTNNLRINFSLNSSTLKALSGRRLQFRIKDRERGDSDWYVIKQTFVRIPTIESVKCTNEMNNQCELRGEGLDYISQVSVDGGRSWTNAGAVEPTAEGNLMMKIPFLINQKFLQIKLRDYPNTEGLTVTNFVYANSVRKAAISTRTNQPNNTVTNQLSNPPLNSTAKPIGNQMLPNNQAAINSDPVQGRPKAGRDSARQQGKKKKN